MHRLHHIAAIAVIAAVTGGCSLKKIAVNKLGNALASTGTTFEGDDDPDLVGESQPFALKLMESLLAESPRHSGLLLATASGFTAYTYAFVGQRADRAFHENLEESNALRGRSRRLYSRARAYGMRALEVRYPGFQAGLDQDQPATLARVRKRDVPVLYWTAAALGSGIAASKEDPEMIAQLPLVDAFIQRASELDENWNEGALAEFMISIEASRDGVKAEDRRARIDRNYQRALRLSGGERASLFVSYAENACIPAQNRAQFREMLDRAIGIDAGRRPATRLATLIAQRRARWLLGRIDDLFLEGEDRKEK